MKKLHIDIVSRTNLNSNFDIEPSFPIINKQNLIIGLNSVDWSGKIKNRTEFSVASIDLETGDFAWETKFQFKLPSKINCDFQIIESSLIGCSSYQLFSIDLNTGKVKWRKNFKKHSSPKLSKINNRIFWSNWGELQELNPNNGKKIMSLKPRVKWFDSKLTKYNHRYFVSTSNSKILELDIDDLSVLNEFKFKGGWAIGCEPYFFRNLIISNSYGSKTMIFNLNDNSVVKSFNRKTGAKPIQNGINEFFLSYNGNSDSKFSCYDLNSLKKKWTIEINRVQFFICKGEEIQMIFKEDDKYRIGRINIISPKEISVLDDSGYRNWENYLFDLWEGVGIKTTGNKTVYTYEPNKILCITSDDDGHSS